MQASIIEASDRLQRLAEPAPAGAHIETLISNVARKVGLTYSRAKAIWYKEARRIDSTEMDALRAASQAKNNGDDLAALRIEHARLLEQAARLQEILAKMDTRTSREGSS